jgi:hypothetical protein
VRERPGAVIVAVCALLLTAPASLAGASSPDPPRHGVHACGSHVLSGHSWTSQIDGVAHERGTHWLVYWAGGRGSCAFAELTLAGLLRFSDRYLGEARSPSSYRGGTCQWTTRAGDGHETIAPFQEIRCTVPITLRGHRFSTTVGALIDPDPRFIGPTCATMRGRIAGEVHYPVPRPAGGGFDLGVDQRRR